MSPFNQNVLTPKPVEKLSAKDFLELASCCADNIKTSKFIPPTLGDGTFGFFEVQYKYPRLKHAKK